MSGARRPPVVAIGDPDDLALDPVPPVVGFDDLQSLSRGLTTIRQDFDAIARAAVELWQGACRGEPPRSIVVPVELIVRDGSAAIAQAPPAR